MPFYVGAAAAVGELALNISNSQSGGGSSGAGGFSGGTTPSGVFIPGGQPQADQNFQAITNSMANTGQSIPQTVIPNLQGAAGRLSANPYAQFAQNASNTGANFGVGTLAPQMEAGANQLFGAGNTALQTAFDPRQALYNRTLQQVTDQSNAINSMYGLSSSPAGAGVADQNITNFNIDWQNQQLARQLAGIHGAGQGFAGGADLGTAAQGTFGSAGAMGYNTFAGNQQNIINANNALSSGANNAFGLDQSTLNALAAYLRLGQGATAQAQAGQAQNFNQQQLLGQQAGGALGQLSGLFGGKGGGSPFGGGAGGGGNPYGVGTTFGPQSGQGFISPSGGGGYGFTFSGY